MKSTTLWALSLVIVLSGCGGEISPTNNIDPKVASELSASSESDSTSSEASNEAVAAVTTQDTEAMDTVWVLDQLREVAPPGESFDGWLIARSPLTWSSFTIKLPGGLGPTASGDVWKAWSKYPTALTMPANTAIRDRIEAAVTSAIDTGKSSEEEFSFKGFLIVITAEPPDTTVGLPASVRIAFIDSLAAG